MTNITIIFINEMAITSVLRGEYKGLTIGNTGVVIRPKGKRKLFAYSLKKMNYIFNSDIKYKADTEEVHGGFSGNACVNFATKNKFSEDYISELKSFIENDENYFDFHKPSEDTKSRTLLFFNSNFNIADPCLVFPDIECSSSIINKLKN